VEAVSFSSAAAWEYERRCHKNFRLPCIGVVLHKKMQGPSLPTSSSFSHTGHHFALGNTMVVASCRPD
jgi:hypothetical protein